MQFADIFKSGTQIRCVDGTPVSVNMTGPKGVHCKMAPSSAETRPAKYNSAAVFMDHLLIDHDVFVAYSSNHVYCEIGNGDFKGTFDGQCTKWEKNIPTADMRMFPMLAFVLSDKILSLDNEEYVDLFKQVTQQVKDSGKADPILVLTACDSFYYSFKTTFGENIRMTDELLPETIEQGFATGQYSVPKWMQSLEMPVPTMAADLFAEEETEKPVRAFYDFESIKAGEYRIAHEWTDEQKEKIPSLDFLDTFVSNSVFLTMVRKAHIRLNNCIERMDMGKTGVEAIGKDFVNTLVIGKPGSGKTTSLYALGAALGMPVYSIACSKNSEEDLFQGMTKVVKGELDFQETDFVKAFKHGGIVILEEMNLLDPAVAMGALGQAVEFPFLLWEDGYQQVTRNPLCIIVGTFNVGTDGSRPLNQAFSSRFKDTLVLDDPKKEDFIEVLKANGHDARKSKWVYDVYTRILNYLQGPDVNKEDYCLNITLRGCLGALDDMEEGDDPMQAVRNTLLGKIAEYDLETAREVEAKVVKIMPKI